MKKILRQLLTRLFFNQPQRLLLLPDFIQVEEYTMCNIPALNQVYELLKDLDQQKIDGDIVETGSWNGGCCAFMAKCSPERKVWMFDSFEGMPEFSEKDAYKAKCKKLEAKANPELKPVGLWKADVEKAKKIIEKVGATNRTKIFKGWFQDTIPKAGIEKIALLRIDGDIYESTKFCLEALYDKVVDGGYIILDDYRGWEGSRHAVFEFFVDRKIAPFIEIFPYGGRAYFRKN